MRKLNTVIQAFASSKAASWLLLLGFFYMIAAASHAGFMAKYALRDGETFFSANSMVAGTADRPFVYRQLLPAIAKVGQSLISDPNSVIFAQFKKVNLNASQSFSAATDANVPGFEYSYRIIYLANFIALFVSLILLRALLLRLNFGQLESVLAPAAFIIAFPYVQSIGGFFYDSMELAFFSGALLLAVQGRLFALIVLTIFATLNKESFLFFIPTLYPILREKHVLKKTLFVLGAALLIAIVIKVYLQHTYQTNPGSEIYVQFFDNIKAYFTPMTYFRNETTYGLPGPSGFFITTIAIMLIIALRGRPAVSAAWKQHFLIALMINAPLFFAFCVAGELRNLSMLYVGSVVFMAAAIKSTQFGFKS